MKNDEVTEVKAYPNVITGNFNDYSLACFFNFGLIYWNGNDLFYDDLFDSVKLVFADKP